MTATRAFTLLAWILPAACGGNERPSDVCEPTLFTEVSRNIGELSPDEGPVLRARAVRVDVARMTATAVTTLAINPFDDVCLIATRERLESSPDGSFVWTGTVAPDGDATFVILGDTVSGSFYNDALAFRVRRLDDETHVVLELDRSAFPPELKPPSPQ